MPKGTKVHYVVEALERKGLPKGQAIAVAQSRTKQSYATGKKLPPKKLPPKLKKRQKGV